MINDARLKELRDYCEHQTWGAEVTDMRSALDELIERRADVAGLTEEQRLYFDQAISEEADIIMLSRWASELEEFLTRRPDMRSAMREMVAGAVNATPSIQPAPVTPSLAQQMRGEAAWLRSGGQLDDPAWLHGRLKFTADMLEQAAA